MNVLPLTLIFMTVFSFLSYAILHSTFSTQLEDTCFSGRARTQHVISSEKEKKLYLSAIRKRSKKSSTSTTRKLNPNKQFENPRMRKNLYSIAKLNIAPLLLDPPYEARAQLYEIAANFIRHLYRKNRFFKSQDEYAILDFIIEEAKKDPDIQSLEDLASKIPSDRELFYKVFKGTQSFILNQGIGYPPLSDYLAIDRSKGAKPIHLHHACAPLLEVLFNEKVVEAILHIEEEKWTEKHQFQAISKEELQLLLNHDHATNYALMDLEKLVEFHKRVPKQTKISRADRKTGILIKTELP